MSRIIKNICPVVKFSPSQKTKITCTDPTGADGGDAHVSNTQPSVTIGTDGKKVYTKPDVGIFGTGDTTLKVEVAINIPTTDWLRDPKFRNYMRIQVVQSTDSEMTNALKEEVDPFLESFYSKAVSQHPGSSYQTQIAVGYSYGAAMVLFFTFEVPNPTSSEGTGHLSYLASTYIDIDQFEKDTGASLPEDLKASLYGDVAVKKVYENSQLLEKVDVLMAAGGAYTGSTHIDLSGKTRTGININDSLMHDDLYKLLQKWTVRSPNLTAGQYYADLLFTTKESADLLREMNRLLKSWTSRDPNTTSGQYYLDLQNVFNFYAALSGKETTLSTRAVSNNILFDQKDCSVFESLCDLDKNYGLTAVQEMLANKLNDDNYFTNLMWTLGPGTGTTVGSTRLLFSIDYANLFRNNSLYDCLFYNTNQKILSELLSYVEIKSVEIRRQDLISPGFSNQTDPEMSVVTGVPPSQDPSGIISGQSIDATGYKSAAIQEVTNFVITSAAPTSPEIAPQYRHFTVLDNYTTGRTDGTIQYIAIITFEDKVLDFIKQRVANLSEAISLLKRYYNLAVLSCSYSTVNSRFTNEFIAMQYKNSNPSTAPWLICPTVYGDVLRCFYNIDDQTALDVAASLFMKLEPTIASPEEINQVIADFETLYSEIITRFGITTTVDKFSKGSAKSKNKVRIREIKHVFDEPTIEWVEIAAPSSSGAFPGQVNLGFEKELLEGLGQANGQSGGGRLVMQTYDPECYDRYLKCVEDGGNEDDCWENIFEPCQEYVDENGVPPEEDLLTFPS